METKISPEDLLDLSISELPALKLINFFANFTNPILHL